MIADQDDSIISCELVNAVAGEIETAIDTGLDPREAVGLAVAAAINSARQHNVTDFLKRLVADIDGCPTPEFLRAS